MLTTMTNRALVLICIAQTTNALYLSGTLADTDLDARASIHRETTTATTGACPAETAETVVYEGFIYRTLTGLQKDNHNDACEDTYTSLPDSTWSLVNFDENIYTAVVETRPWNTDGMVFNQDGTWHTGGDWTGGPTSSWTAMQSGNMFKVPVCSLAILIRKPCDTTTAQPTPAPEASATGDPHLQNIHGERFDLMRPGNTVLIQIPRGHPVEKALLTVEADARRLGMQCADIYFQSLNITGMWTNTDHHFDAWSAFDESPSWLKFGPVQLKVVRGYTEKGLAYLNFYVKHLGRAGAVVGGLLGEDDHTDAAQSDENCRKTVALAKNPPQLRDGSLAMASSQ